MYCIYNKNYFRTINEQLQFALTNTQLIMNRDFQMKYQL